MSYNAESLRSCVSFYESIEGKMKQIIAQGELMEAVDQARAEWRVGSPGRRSQAEMEIVKKQTKWAIEQWESGVSRKDIAKELNITECALSGRILNYRKRQNK
jgi:ATP-dependent protease HslVU (ClpYQ) peptidase subunit